MGLNNLLSWRPGSWGSSGRALLALLLVVFDARLDAQVLDSVRVEEFFDRAWAETLRDGGAVPGAVITVVHDRSVVLNKGYGVTDIATAAAVDPSRTRVRIGSVSKLFTALTALALVDEGRLHLDRDVNDYLRDVRVPGFSDDPVTVRALLSHRAGFDTGYWGYTSRSSTDVALSREAYQRRLLPARAPDRAYGYDNLGVGLLGYLTGQVNGTSFAGAVDAKVIRPLGLEKTTVGVPDWQSEHLAACHTWDASGQPVKCMAKFVREGYQAAGDVTTTGSDMARFMSALLNGGCLDGTCVLQPGTFAHFMDLDMNRLHPSALGMGFLIYEKDMGGRHALGDDGGQDGFSTSVTLFPESRVGVFVSLFSFVGIPEDWNLSTIFDFVIRGRRHDPYGNTLRVQQRFAEALLPAPAATARARRFRRGADLDLSSLAGNYVTTEFGGPMLLDKVLRVTTPVKVSVHGVAIRVNDTGPFRHTGGGVFERDGDNAKWLFTRTEHEVLLQRADALAFEMYTKRPWHWNAAFTFLPFVIPALLAVPGAILAVSRRRSVPRRTLGLLVAFTGAALACGVYLELEYFADNYYPSGPTLALVAWRLLLNLGWLAALCGLWVIWSRRRDLISFRSIGGSATSLLVGLFALGALTVAVLLPYWHLVGNLWAP
jgi:CubicO group peptidase (beta-lactamase class C family)